MSILNKLQNPFALVVQGFLVGGLLFSQVITLYITPVIYLALDRFSGKGPITTVEGEVPAVPEHKPA